LGLEPATFRLVAYICISLFRMTNAVTSQNMTIPPGTLKQNSFYISLWSVGWERCSCKLAGRFSIAGYAELLASHTSHVWWISLDVFGCPRSLLLATLPVSLRHLSLFLMVLCLVVESLCANWNVCEKCNGFQFYKQQNAIHLLLICWYDF
jgi:hypothetical protein